MPSNQGSQQINQDVPEKQGRTSGLGLLSPGHRTCTFTDTFRIPQILFPGVKTKAICPEKKKETYGQKCGGGGEVTAGDLKGKQLAEQAEFCNSEL